MSAVCCFVAVVKCSFTEIFELGSRLSGEASQWLEASVMQTRSVYCFVAGTVCG